MKVVQNGDTRALCEGRLEKMVQEITVKLNKKRWLCADLLGLVRTGVWSPGVMMMSLSEMGIQR